MYMYMCIYICIYIYIYIYISHESDAQGDFGTYTYMYVRTPSQWRRSDFKYLYLQIEGDSR